MMAALKRSRRCLRMSFASLRHHAAADDRALIFRRAMMYSYRRYPRWYLSPNSKYMSCRDALADVINKLTRYTKSWRTS